jgi:putative transposase
MGHLGPGPPLRRLGVGCPTFRGFRKVGTTDLSHVHSSHTHSLRLCYEWSVANRLHRYYGAGYLHFITTSCYQRRPLLDSRRSRDLFLQVLERVRRRYHFVVIGYVVMPEHVHLLLGELERGNPSLVMQAVKQGFARRVLRSNSDRRQTKLAGNAGLGDGLSDHVWQRRFYDFVVFTEKKRVEKLRYMHRNPVKRGLVLEPQQWPWSSFCDYAEGRRGPVLVNEARKAEMTVRDVA